MKELTEVPVVSASRRAFELARSFDPEDDFEFCRGLWTEDDVRANPASTPTYHPSLAQSHLITFLTSACSTATRLFIFV